WKVVSERALDISGTVSIADKVAPPRRITPRTRRIPMPGLDTQLGIQPVTDRTPPRGEHALDMGRVIKNVNQVQRIAINTSPQRTQRTERICGVSPGNVHFDWLSKQRKTGHYQHEADIESF